MTSFDMSKYTLDVRAYIWDEWLAADNPMYVGETYVNSLGVEYKVLKDSPAGNSYVKVKRSYKLGSSILEIPKIILCS